MNRFTFPAKFFLISMLFAVPLSITSVQSVLDSNHQLRTINIKHTGVQRIGEFLSVIEALETMRDLSVAKRFHRSGLIEAKFDDSKRKAISEIDRFIGSKQNNTNQLIRLSLFSLKRSVQTLNLSSGSEADLESTIFEKVNAIVNAAYIVQSQLANVNGLLGDIDPLANHLVTILSAELQRSAEAMGEARAYGTYFIAKRLISSFGITLINDSLSKLQDNEEQLRDRFTVLLSSYPKFNDNLAIDPAGINELGEMFYLIDEQVLLDPDLLTPIDDFWQQATASMEKFNQFRRGIVLFLERYYAEEEAGMKAKQRTYGVAIGALICVFLYLFIGFYLAVKDSLATLSKAAVQVSKGSLDESVLLETHDELANLASLFDKMRIQLKDRQQELIETTITDALTGVRNRKYFNDSLKQNIARCRKTDQPTSLLLMDIDHFKRVNDTYGHPAGDKCLQLVAACLQKNLSRPDDVIARYGGEEFAVLLPATDQTGAINLAEKLCQSVRDLSFTVDQHSVAVTISIGISSSNLIPNCEEEKLVNLADEALYKAKDSGRNKWVSAHA